MELNQTLREHRQKQGLTQQQLADRLFVSNKTISNWETGKTLPDIESLIRLANLFDLSLDNLLLEGSDIVEDIKAKEKAYAVQQAATLGPQLANILLMLLLFLPTISDYFYMSDSLFFILVAVILANYFSFLYFKKEVEQYKGTEMESRTMTIINRLYFVILVIVFAAALAAKYIF